MTVPTKFNRKIINNDKLKKYIDDTRKSFPEELLRYYDLWTMILFSGLKDKHIIFKGFESKDHFKYICNTINLDEDIVLELIKEGI